MNLTSMSGPQLLILVVSIGTVVVLTVWGLVLLRRHKDDADIPSDISDLNTHLRQIMSARLTALPHDEWIEAQEQIQHEVSYQVRLYNRLMTNKQATPERTTVLDWREEQKRTIAEAEYQADLQARVEEDMQQADKKDKPVHKNGVPPNGKKEPVPEKV